MRSGHVKWIITVCDWNGHVLHQEAIVDVMPSVAETWRSVRGTALGIAFKGARVHVNKIKAQPDPLPIEFRPFKTGKIDAGKVPHGTYSLTRGSVYDSANRQSEGKVVPLDRIYVR